MPNDIKDWTSSTQANVAPSVAATQSSAAGQAVILLPSTSIFTVGDLVNVTSGLVTGTPAASTTTFIKAINPDVSITLQVNLNAICNVGDVVQRIPVFVPFGQPIIVREAGPGVTAPKVVPIANTVNAGANAVLIAAVAGQIVYCFSCSMVFDAVVAGSGMNLQDTAGDSFAQFSASVQAPPAQEYHGGTEATQSAVGLGIRIANPSGSQMTVRGHLTVFQG